MLFCNSVLHYSLSKISPQRTASLVMHSSHITYKSMHTRKSKENRQTHFLWKKVPYLILNYYVSYK